MKNSPLLESYQEELQRIFSTYPITAYNKAFDLGFLKARGFSFPREGPCPMIVSTPILKISKRYGRYGRNDYKWPTVEEAWEFFYPEHAYWEAHRAYDDAMHEAKIVYALYERGKWRL